MVSLVDKTYDENVILFNYEQSLKIYEKFIDYIENLEQEYYKFQNFLQLDFNLKENDLENLSICIYKSKTTLNTIVNAIYLMKQYLKT